MGQHFLRDGQVAAAMASALPDRPAQVLEIGPGKGALTTHLLQRFPRVRAVELDEGLARTLPGRLGRPAGLEVVVGDAAAVDLDEVTGGEAWSAAGNLPYSVATAILRRLMERGDLFPVLVLMVQREVAARMTAAPGGKERGYLSVLVEARGTARSLFSVPPRSFTPPPRVVSGVVEVITRRPEELPPAAGRALGLAATAFSHRRKKLTNALASQAEPSLVAEVLPRLGLAPAVRPQELSWMQWLRLAETLPKAGERE